MTQEIRPPTPSSVPTPEQPRGPNHATGLEPVKDLQRSVGDAIRTNVAGASAGPARAAEQDPRSPAGRLKRLYDVWEMPLFFSIHLKSDGYMDLVIEKLQKDRISLTHYGEMNGDLMKDPDVEVLLLPDGTIRGVTFQNDYVGGVPYLRG